MHSSVTPYLCDTDKIHVGKVCFCQAIMPHTARQALLQYGVLRIKGLMLCKGLWHVNHSF